MTQLGLPKKAETCAHTAPTFGCRGCINRDRLAILQLACDMLPKPPCPECGGPTTYYDDSFEAMTITYVCCKRDWDEDGVVAGCQGEVELEVKR